MKKKPKQHKRTKNHYLPTVMTTFKPTYLPITPLVIIDKYKIKDNQNNSPALWLWLVAQSIFEVRAKSIWL